jgi:hypothetical protein
MSPLIPPQELLSLLVVFSPCFTRPGFVYFVQFVVAMVVGVGRITTTRVFRSSDGTRHYTNYARFLSRYRWSVEDVAQRLLDLLVSRHALWLDHQGRQRLCLIIDETIVEKTSKRMFGVAWQRNTHGGLCRGTHILGHYWLMLGVLVRVGGRVLCCPVGLRLYRQKKRCPAEEYRKPAQVAMDLLQGFSWATDPSILRTIVADAGFADQHFLRWCHREGFVVVVRGRMDAQIHDLYVAQPAPLRGRPRKWGERLSLTAYAADETHFTHRVHLYQERMEVRVACLVARHRVSGLVMQFVITRRPGKDDVVIMCSDLGLTPREITGLYADRFSIEMTFRELKQHFGLGHYQVRIPRAIESHVQLSAVACTLTQLLAIAPHDGGDSGLNRWTPMPWRKAGTVISLYEAQHLIHQACLPSPAFCKVGLQPPNAKKPTQTKPTAHPHDRSAEL